MIKINIRNKNNGEVTPEIKDVSKIYIVKENTAKKVVQIWKYIDSGIKKVFSLISSCFGSGTWVSAEKWIDTELWK